MPDNMNQILPTNIMTAVLSRSNMKLSWEQVLKNKGAPGIDNVTLERWGRNWEANIERLQEQARGNTYHPNRPKRFIVTKKGGGVRELSRLTVADKVMQRAVLNVLDPYIDTLFMDCSHAYRPKRSVATAVQQVLDYRDDGWWWVLDADIEGCFDHLDHEILLNLLSNIIDDWFTLNLMSLWLRAGRKHRHRAVGVPMGAVLSPLWCNIYLHQFDVYMTQSGLRLVRYADDFLLLAQERRHIERCYDETEAALDELKLKLSAAKTRITSFDEGFIFLGVEFIEDRYSYTWEQKHIEVQGRDTRLLYKHLPQFYSQERK